MREKRVMVVGPAGSGKSTLVQALEGEAGPVSGTPQVRYGRRTIDCPGAYLENRGMYCHLLALAQDAACLLLVMAADRPEQIYSPGFSRAFGRPAAGVVTKMDLAPEGEALCRARLRRAGVDGPIFSVCVPTGQGVGALLDYLAPLLRKEDSAG